MAARIERVEREFIITTAAEAKSLARIQTRGRTVVCTMGAVDRQSVRFGLKGGDAKAFEAWEKVSVYFDFHGQGFVFDSVVRKSSGDLLELSYPETMFRGLSRKWPRVKPPRDLSVDILLPDGGLKLACPVSREYVDVDLPDSRGGLKAESLAILIESFRAKASELCDENRVIMFKEGKGPQDLAEELVSTWGRALFIPSVISGLPLVDPYPEGRVVTKSSVEEASDDFGLSIKSRLASFIDDKAGSGLQAALWCPVRFYRWTIGVAYLANRDGSQRPFDFRMLDFAWDFTRLLAWFLKSYGYYESGKKANAPRRGAIVNASPTGILVGLGEGQPRFRPGSRIEIELGIGEGRHPCVGRIVRHFEEEGRSYYGLAMEDLGPESLALLTSDLYGSGTEVPAGQGG